MIILLKILDGRRSSNGLRCGKRSIAGPEPSLSLKKKSKGYAKKIFQDEHSRMMNLSYFISCKHFQLLYKEILVAF